MFNGGGVNNTIKVQREQSGRQSFRPDYGREYLESSGQGGNKTPCEELHVLFSTHKLVRMIN